MLSSKDESVQFWLILVTERLPVKFVSVLEGCDPVGACWAAEQVSGTIKRCAMALAP
jgi:hypothetical protein